MSAKAKEPRNKHVASSITIPREEWNEFLQSFNERHLGSRVRIETHDLKTGERVVSPETPLRSVELDLEDEPNPRINVVVERDNKVIKHILFRPSLLVLFVSRHGSNEALHIETVNTSTTVRFHDAEA